MEPQPYLRFEWNLPAPDSVRVLTLDSSGSPCLAAGFIEGRAFEAKNMDDAQRDLRPSRLRIADDQALVSYAQTYGLFGLRFLGSAAGEYVRVPGKGKRLAIVEPLNRIRLAVLEYHLALELRAEIAAGRRNLDSFLKMEGEEKWRLRWKLPTDLKLPAGLSVTGTNLSANGARLAVRKGFLDSWSALASPVHASTAREAGRTWLGLLMAARSEAWTRLVIEPDGERLQRYARVTGPLGMAWHRLADDPEPLLCERCGTPFQPSPRLKKKHAAYCQKSCAAAARRERNKAPKGRRRKKT